jgi:dipeptidyl aminopeptidase/acylaminoacyl peptidase
MPSRTTGRRACAVPRTRLRPLRGLLLRLCSWVLLGAAVCGPATARQQLGPTVTEVVEFTRIVQPRDGDKDQLQAQVSPDGTRVFIVTRKANTVTDKNRYQLLLLDVGPQQLASGLTAPDHVKAPTVLASFDAFYDNDSAYPALQDARWADAQTIVFRGRVHGPHFQVYKVNTRTRRLVQLSFSPMGVVSYAVSGDLRRVLYTAPHPNPPLGPDARSVVVGNQSFWSVKFGQHDLRAQQRRYQYFVAESGSRRPARALGAPFAEASSFVPSVSISPDGRWALVPRYEPERQLAWGQQYPLVAQATARFGSALTTDPLNYFSRPGGYVARRLVAYRLADGREQTVVDAPDDSLPAGAQARSDRLWQRGGRSVVIAGTHLPLPADDERGVLAPPGADAYQAGASHLIEYWPDTGRWEVIAPLRGRLEAAHQTPGAREGFVAIDGGQRRQFQRQAGGAWQELASTQVASGAAATGARLGAGWALRIAEGLNVPTDLVADGPDGRRLMLTRLNPQFSAAWGTMRPYSWTDTQARVWNAGLMVPAGFDAGSRHALVIQTYGFSPARFYLDGANARDGFTSGFAGRAFLRENILVLAMPVRASNGWPATDAAAMAAAMEGVNSAIEALVGEGLVDRQRIGIMGWSATGERVLNQVTFSSAPIRAASIMDGDANTVFSMAVTYGASDSILARKERINGGPPFGDGLERWVRNDPALHTDCVKAALRIETYGPWVLNNWDIHALLRRQYKAAEMVVIPGGTHGLMTPSERMISLQGNVDWHRFWLSAEERTQVFLWGETEASLKAQYTRWQQMAELKRADDPKPDCARKSGGGDGEGDR